MQIQILYSRPRQLGIIPKEGNLFTGTFASSARLVPSLVLEFDSELGSNWRGPVGPNAKTAETHLRSSANAVNSISVPTTMLCSRLNRANQRERLVGEPNSRMIRLVTECIWTDTDTRRLL